jgi:hypothetical protein
VLPVSDPNIFSNVQRIAQAQALVQLTAENGDIYSRKDKIRAHKNMLKAIKIPDADGYLDDTMQRLDPVAENEAMANGQPVQVFREQDDAAHMLVHQNFRQEVAAMPPEVQNKIMPVIDAHLTSHYVQAYRKRVEAVVMQQIGVPLPPYNPNDKDDNIELPPEMEAAIARAAAAYAPPPPPVTAPQEDPKMIAAAREADRKDMLAERDAERKDLAQIAQLRRDGVISDLPELPPTPTVSQAQPAPM